MAIKVLAVSRKSVTLSWAMHADAFAYMVRRVTRLADGVMDDALRATVYQGLYCDPGLTPGTEYLFELTSIAAPDGEEPDEPVDRQRVRIRTLPELEYPTVRAFFADFVAPTFRRRLSTNAHRWCPEWFRHPEALYALTELWNAYEAMRPPEPPEPPGKVRAEWLVVFAWPVLDRLTAQDGPFRDCYLNDVDGGGRRHVGPPEAESTDLPDTPVAPLP